MPENITYWRDASFDGVESCLVSNSRHSFPKHAHDTVYAVGLMDKGGSYSLGAGREEGFVGAGDIALINPGQVHSGVPAQDVAVTYRMLYFDIAFMQKAANDLDNGKDTLPEFTTVVVTHPVLRQRLSAAYHSIATHADPLEIESLLFEALAALLSGYAGFRRTDCNKQIHPRAVRQAKDVLMANLDQKITLKALARAVGISPFHLLRLFKRHTGLSPHQYRTQGRIDMAKALLRKGVPFAQVALETGFTDQSHFTNRFKQLTAATPRQYR